MWPPLFKTSRYRRGEGAHYSNYPPHVPVILAGPHERRLINDLMRSYKNLERPVANESEAVVLKFGLTLQQIMDVVSSLVWPLATPHTQPESGSMQIKWTWSNRKELWKHNRVWLILIMGQSGCEKFVGAFIPSAFRHSQCSVHQICTTSASFWTKKQLNIN